MILSLVVCVIVNGIKFYININMSNFNSPPPPPTPPQLSIGKDYRKHGHLARYSMPKWLQLMGVDDASIKMVSEINCRLGLILGFIVSLRWVISNYAHILFLRSIISPPPPSFNND
jgi:hypothetical protein